jgi:hypothetical protein
MHVMFEVYLTPGSFGQNLLTEETKADTQAQIMTKAEAEAVGFAGIPDDPQGRERRFIVCAQKDARRIQNALNASAEVAAYDAHEINM